MSNKFDDFIDRLQEQIYDEAKTALGTKGFERWLNPRYRGIIKNPDGYASTTGACGDTMQIFLKLKNECVTEATFQTDGCGRQEHCETAPAPVEALADRADSAVSCEYFRNISFRQVGSSFYTGNLGLFGYPFQKVIDSGTESASHHPISLFLMGKCACTKVNGLGPLAFQYFPQIFNIIPGAVAGEYADQFAFRIAGKPFRAVAHTL